MSSQKTEPPPPPKKRQGVWYLVVALFLYIAAIVIFFYLADLERTGTAASMNAVVVLLYKLGGKWLVAGLTAVIATGMVLLAIGEFRKPRE